MNGNNSVDEKIKIKKWKEAKIKAPIFNLLGEMVIESLRKTFLSRFLDLLVGLESTRVAHYNTTP